MAKRGEVLCALSFQHVRLGPVARYRVPLVVHSAVGTRDIPSSPAILKRSAVVSHRHPEVEGGHAAGVGINRRDHDPWNSNRGGALMALQANVAAIKPWLVGLVDVERVKNEALLWI